MMCARQSFRAPVRTQAVVQVPAVRAPVVRHVQAQARVQVLVAPAYLLLISI